MDIDKMIENLLEMDIIGDDDSVTFTDEAKQLIHEISEKCPNIGVIVEKNGRIEDYGKGLSAEEVYVDMFHMIVRAASAIHMRMSVMMMIPIIDQKIRGEEKAIE